MPFLFTNCFNSRISFQNISIGSDPQHQKFKKSSIDFKLVVSTKNSKENHFILCFVYVGNYLTEFNLSIDIVFKVYMF